MMKLQNKINKKNWEEIHDKIRSSNKEFYELITPISQHLAEKEKYVYFFDLLYGTSVIHEGHPSIFDNTNLCVGVDNITIEDIKNDLVGINTDFPLSLITKNYVEIFRKNNYKHIKNDKFDYYLPIEIIKENCLFGVWGAVETILYDSKKEQLRENWNGVTGRQCFVSLFELRPIEHFNTFIKIFSEIFGREYLLNFKDKSDVDEIRKKATRTAEAIQSFISTNIPTSNIEFYSFPKHFYIIGDNDNAELKILKHRLQDYLYALAWSEKESKRELEMQGLLIKEMYEKERIDYNYSMNSIRLLKHFYGILKGKAMYLKSVSESDPIEYAAFLAIIDKMNTIEDSFTEFCPHFLYYDKKTNWNIGDSGIEFMALPAISDFFVSDSELKYFRKQLSNDIFHEKGNNPKAGLKFFIENSCDIKIDYTNAIDTKDVLKFLNFKFGKNNDAIEYQPHNQYYFDRTFPKIFLSYLVHFKITS